MDAGDPATCVLCKRSEETGTTGPLSTKCQVTAHQNCLESPLFDDLFGFNVKDVLNEVKRGRKLVCNKCKKKGATAGCEVKRCKRSYHYPCAIEEGAMVFEDSDQGNYGLYCFHHTSVVAKRKNFPSDFSCGTRADGCSKAKRSKECRLTCEKKFVFWRSFTGRKSGSVDGDSPAARKLANRSDSNSRDSVKYSASKRKQVSSKRPRDSKRLRPSSSSDTEGELPSLMAQVHSYMAPLDFSSDNESPPNRTIESIARSSSEDHGKDERGGEVNDEEEIDPESEYFKRNGKSKSLLPKNNESAGQPNGTMKENVVIELRDDEGLSPDPNAGGPSVLQQNSAVPPLSPDHLRPRSVISSPPRTSSTFSRATSPMAPQFKEETINNSASFWSREFMKEINIVSSRIQSNQASQEDYDIVLRVMEASWKLAELVTKQQKEFQRKQGELFKAAASMDKVISAMKR